MKKLSILTIAILATSNVYAMDLYSDNGNTVKLGGRAEARMGVYNSDSKAASGKENHDQTVYDESRGRINLDAKTSISDDVYARGFFENEYKTADSEFNNRYLFVAIGNENNELQYGHTAGSLGIVTDLTDIYNTYGGEAQSKLKTSDRATNQMLYVGTFDGLTIKAHANGGGDDFSFTTDHAKEFSQGKIEFGAGAAATYNVSNLTIGLGGAYEDITGLGVKDKGVDTGKAYELVGGISYVIGDFYLGTAVNSTNVSNDVSNKELDSLGYEAVVKYSVSDAIDVIGGYSNTSYDVDGSNLADDEFVSSEVSYKFNETFLTYAGLEYQLDGVSKDSVSALLGAKLTF